MGRAPCCDNGDRNKGAWTKEEDEKLIQYIQTHGEGCWRSLPKAAGLLRCGKSCRLRWINYLRPDLKRGNFSEDEEDLIFKLHALLGNKWSLIAGRLPGRTDNEIKNYWNSHLKRKLVSRGVDPLTHRPFHSTTPRRPSAKPNVAQLETYEDKCSGETTVDDCFQPGSDHRSEQISSKSREDLPNLNLELSITSPPSINDHTVPATCDHSTVQSKPAGSYGRRSSAGDENGLNPAGCYVDFPRTMLLLR